ncbi:nicotinate-nucleotide--dimethylbenzimidazole phosphoribosyltransferase [Helicovermis profundi]|uniref:Nicotinate-nucleotide--dimethylbenzimidazole phosphoribosyltransferase n=1 Tax=Helicovermis profundi TaxID=3065157 RepID=A0AAU9E0W2_9FIRM|nr:nicotinate-nucleotide--dimethylbenzimidazole phosphoribosyltransferase [Clostridia bacterium S502]
MLESTLRKIKSVNKKTALKSIERVDNLVKPKGSLGMLEEIVVKLSAIQNTKFPKISNKEIIVFASDHGIFEEGVAITPREVTLIQAENMILGVTGVCALAKNANSKVIVVDVGIDADVKNNKIINKKIRKGTSNFTKGPAMSREEAIRSIEIGIEIANSRIDLGADILGTGEMGIGNTTPSSAILSVIGGYKPSEVTGIGANLPLERLEKKIDVIDKGIKFNKPNKNDPIDVLSKVGGFEIGAMAGAMIGGASRGVPVIVDGFISSAAALIAIKLEPKVKDYLFASHFSKEKGAFLASKELGLKTPLHLDLRLGEGTGAAIMFSIIEFALAMNNNMVTFDEGGFKL